MSDTPALIPPPKGPLGGALVVPLQNPSRRVRAAATLVAGFGAGLALAAPWMDTRLPNGVALAAGLLLLVSAVWLAWAAKRTADFPDFTLRIADGHLRLPDRPLWKQKQRDVPLSGVSGANELLSAEQELIRIKLGKRKRLILPFDWLPSVDRERWRRLILVRLRAREVDPRRIAGLDALALHAGPALGAVVAADAKVLGLVADLPHYEALRGALPPDHLLVVPDVRSLGI